MDILEKENRQLKEQLNEKIRNEFKLKDELFKKRKEYQETYKDVQAEIKDYKQQIKQRDEVIDKIGKIIDTANCRYMTSGKVYVNSFCLSDLYKILNKYKGDNNE